MMRKILKPYFNKYVLANNVLQESHDTAKGDLFGDPDNNVRYAYTIAKIDSDDKGAGALNGKTNPMTSKHNISASVIYSLSNKTNMTLTQKYRSEAFAEEDYANIFTKKQPEYNSTNFNFSYNPNDDLSFSFDVENLFENSYGTRLRDDVIYPGNSTRNIKAGLTYKF